MHSPESGVRSSRWVYGGDRVLAAGAGREVCRKTLKPPGGALGFHGKSPESSDRRRQRQAHVGTGVLGEFAECAHAH